MNVLVSTDSPRLWADLLPDHTVDFVPETPDAIAAAFDSGSHEAVYLDGPLDRPPPPSLRLVQLSSAGYEQMLGHPWLDRVPHVTTAAGTCAHYIAEHITLAVLASAKALPLHHENQRRHRWPADRAHFPHRSPRGQCAIILGYGAVGRQTARLLASLGLDLIAVTRSGQRQPFHGWLPEGVPGDPDGSLPRLLVPTGEIDNALAVADYVILCLPLNPATHNLLNRARLAAIKPGAVLINIGRGAMIDDDALRDSLDETRLAHAWLDVFRDEPLPPSAPWWDHPRVTLTPHISGIMPPVEVARHHAALLRENLRRLAAGQPCFNRLRHP